MRWIKIALMSLLVAVAQAGFAAGKASHVVLVVWDGMRPDFVSETNTPNLWSLARHGVTFLRHHPVYPSMTEVNATALATGVYPEESTIIGNNEYRPAYNPFEPIQTYENAIVRQGDGLTSGHYIAFPTVAEVLQSHELYTAVAASKPVGLLHDRATRFKDTFGVTLFAGITLPQMAAKDIYGMFGSFPEATSNKIDIDQWTTGALTESFWSKKIPSFSLLWLAEPDYSQHETGPGSDASLAAIKSSDDNLGRVLQAVQKKNPQGSTDIIVVSDHGFSTILDRVDVVDILQKNGFQASGKFTQVPPNAGDIMVVPNGGVFYCYVTGHDSKLIGRLVSFIQSQPFAGVVFTKTPMPGTLLLSDLHINSAYAPDIAVAMRWKPTQSKGVPDFIYAAGDRLGPGQGQHASLSPTDMHNMCFAAGPDFAIGMKDSLASGNIDIAPTILWILGIEPEKKMSGRVLGEAMTGDAPKNFSSRPRMFEAEVKADDSSVWREYVQATEVNGVVYFDQGNGGQTYIPKGQAQP